MLTTKEKSRSQGFLRTTDYYNIISSQLTKQPLRLLLRL